MQPPHRWLRVGYFLSGHRSRQGALLLPDRGHDGVLWCATRFLLSNSGFKKKKTEKRSSLRNLKLLHGNNSIWSTFFVLQSNFTHFLRAQAVIWGGTAGSKCQPVILGLLPSFGVWYSLEGHIFRLGAQAIIWEGRPRNAPYGAWPAQ